MNFRLILHGNLARARFHHPRRHEQEMPIRPADLELLVWPVGRHDRQFNAAQRVKRVSDNDRQTNGIWIAPF